MRGVGLAVSIHNTTPEVRRSARERQSPDWRGVSSLCQRQGLPLSWKTPLSDLKRGAANFGVGIQRRSKVRQIFHLKRGPAQG
jgi:hypothetical protein